MFQQLLGFVSKPCAFLGDPGWTQCFRQDLEQSLQHRCFAREA